MIESFNIVFPTSSNALMRRDKYSRMFHRLATGLQIAKNSNAFMRFMTLTSADYQKRHIKKSFDILRKRIHRATYDKDGFRGFKFNRYFCLRTYEGNGVLHILYWGQFIPQKWLSKTWSQIHGAKIVDIRACFSKRRKVNGLVGYLITRYLQKQPIERMSYGWKWAWLGFCNSWKKFKEVYGQMRTSAIESFKLYGRYAWRYTCYYTNQFYKFATFIVPSYNFHGKYRNGSLEAWQTVLHDPPPSSYQVKLKKYF